MIASHVPLVTLKTPETVNAGENEARDTDISCITATDGASSFSMGLSLRFRALNSWLAEGFSHALPSSLLPRPDAGIDDAGDYT